VSDHIEGNNTIASYPSYGASYFIRRQLMKSLKKNIFIVAILAWAGLVAQEKGTFEFPRTSQGL
jgi:hypothetical protein